MRKPAYWLLIATAFLLGACETSMPVAKPPEMSFSRYQPIYLDVASIDAVDEYTQQMQLPHVEKIIPYSPTEAMHIWVKDRLRGVGAEKSLQVIVKDGSVIVTDLPKPGGLISWFTTYQDKRYDAKLAVEIRIYQEGVPLSIASININVNRTTSIPENATPTQRDAILRRLIDDLMEEANAELEKNIYQYFGNYISYAHTP